MENPTRLSNRNLFQCQHNNRGYCKFGDKCKYQHFTETCKNRACKVKDCRFRHPKPCRNKEDCKFFKRDRCAYNHSKDDSQKRCGTREVDTKIKGYEEEIAKLKLEIKKLKALLKTKEADMETIVEENKNFENINEPLNETVKHDTKFPCEKCNFTFESKNNFEYHLKGIQHNITVGHEFESSFSDEEDYDDFRETCVLCRRIFTTFDSLDDHQSNYIRCEKCEVCYHNEFEFKEHESCGD